jgi:two-component system, chemotaxis family, CheB/CheR fusion protein
MVEGGSPSGTPPPRAKRSRAPRARASSTHVVDFPLVAIGASAGGLDAFRTLVGSLRANSGMAFILVQHLDPSHESMMVELISPATSMPVVEAADAMRLEPDHVYIIPPGRFLSVRDGAARLSSPPNRPAVRMPFDFLLASMAEEQGERAVCIILSGTASDGSAGAKLVKAAGGLVIAQDPDEADYDGMPRNAIAAGGVDLVLPLAMIPKALEKYGGHRYVRKYEGDDPPPAGGSYAQIVELLRLRTSHDFTLYKTGTIERRIERRMALNGVADLPRYLEQLNRDPAELQRLTDDLLINVTRFFRDPKPFEVLEQQVIPELVRTQPPEQPIRVWVAGCSTGEEAYSIAMLLLDEIAKSGRNIRLQIFATDIDGDAIASAREGLYPPEIEVDVPPARLARYFVRDARNYRVSRELRAPIVFSVHDLVADAPFSRLDIVSCRNLLIYLRPEVQQKVISLFHFALRDGGVLFLGESETVGFASDRFIPISKTQRIYRQIGRARPGAALPLGRGGVARALWAQPATVRPSVRSGGGVGELAHRLLLDSYAPASVLVSRRGQGLFYFGATDLYLRMPTGEASLDVLASAREGLRASIRAAIEKAAQTQEVATAGGRVKRGGVAVAVKIIARPLTSAGENLVLLSFVDASVAGPEADAQAEPPAEMARVARLEEELDATRKDLEDAIRDREVAEEEIRAINEEAMSVNEEFQTTNEELETSHEELQSLNEELTALNSQLQDTLSQQRAVADDLENILNSSDLATVFLDEKLNIRFFTPAAKTLFAVIASDIGRPLADLAHRFANARLLEDARTVLSNLAPIVREVEGDDGAWYNCRILPYRTKDNRIEGVVITFADISARKRAEDMANAARLQAQSANLGKSRFLAAASHDLRQPLQTLSLLQGVLARKLKDREEAQLMARADEALMAMSGMLNTLLDINQLEAGVIRPEMVDFPINDLLATLRTEFGYHTKAKGLGWRVLPCRLAVHSDPRLLDQMIRNLLSNAVKYTKTGRLVLGCRRRANRLRIEIWDTGLGIPEEQLQAIFDEFHQVDNPTRTPSRGLGLGLAIVQRLADLMGVAVDVRSREGRGSAFSIEVPLAPPGARLALPGPAQVLEAPASRGGAILIVEDDPGLRESLELLLNAEGFAVTAAADGAAAIRRVETEGLRPDLVIVDYNLPGELNGLQVMARLHEVLATGVPALVLTGDISTKALREIAAHGFAHGAKPVISEDLLRAVRRLLAARERANAPARTSPTAAKDKPGPVTFLVDDDGALRESMGELFREHGRAVEAYPSAEAFLRAYRPDTEGCLLVDAVMPGMDGLALLERLRDAGHRLPAIMMTGSGDVRTAVRAMRAGASDFIEKPVGGNELFESIDRAMARRGDSAGRSATRAAAAKVLAVLTPRQRQILDCVLAGQASKNIAADLGISQRTVEAHRFAIMHKTGSRSLSELVRLALSAA